MLIDFDERLLPCLLELLPLEYHSLCFLFRPLLLYDSFLGEYRWSSTWLSLWCSVRSINSTRQFQNLPIFCSNLACLVLIIKSVMTFQRSLDFFSHFWSLMALIFCSSYSSSSLSSSGYSILFLTMMELLYGVMKKSTLSCSFSLINC